MGNHGPRSNEARVADALESIAGSLDKLAELVEEMVNGDDDQEDDSTLDDLIREPQPEPKPERKRG